MWISLASGQREDNDSRTDYKCKPVLTRVDILGMACSEIVQNWYIGLDVGKVCGYFNKLSTR